MNVRVTYLSVVHIAVFFFRFWRRQSVDLPCCPLSCITHTYIYAHLSPNHRFLRSLCLSSPPRACCCAVYVLSFPSQNLASLRFVRSTGRPRRPDCINLCGCDTHPRQHPTNQQFSVLLLFFLFLVLVPPPSERGTPCHHDFRTPACDTIRCQSGSTGELRHTSRPIPSRSTPLPSKPVVSTTFFGLDGCGVATYMPGYIHAWIHTCLHT